MEKKKRNSSTTLRIGVFGIIFVAAILVLGTLWVGQAAKKDTESAVRSVSLLYLDELAGRREQVVASNLNNKIDQINSALELIA